MKVGFKCCTKCGLEKEATEANFTKCPHAKSGLQSWCRICFGVWQKTYAYERRQNPITRQACLAHDKRSNQKKTPLDHRRNNLKKHYGLSLDAWEKNV